MRQSPEEGGEEIRVPVADGLADFRNRKVGVREQVPGRFETELGLIRFHGHSSLLCKDAVEVADAEFEEARNLRHGVGVADFEEENPLDCSDSAFADRGREARSFAAEKLSEILLEEEHEIGCDECAQNRNGCSGFGFPLHCDFIPERFQCWINGELIETPCGDLRNLLLCARRVNLNADECRAMRTVLAEAPAVQQKIRQKKQLFHCGHGADRRVVDECGHAAGFDDVHRAERVFVLFNEYIGIGHGFMKVQNGEFDAVQSKSDRMVAHGAVYVPVEFQIKVLHEFLLSDNIFPCQEKNNAGVSGMSGKIKKCPESGVFLSERDNRTRINAEHAVFTGNDGKRVDADPFLLFRAAQKDRTVEMRCFRRKRKQEGVRSNLFQVHMLDALRITSRFGEGADVQFPFRLHPRIEHGAEEFIRGYGRPAAVAGRDAVKHDDREGPRLNRLLMNLRKILWRCVLSDVDAARCFQEIVCGEEA